MADARVTVVGLGPAGAEYLTVAAAAAIAEIPHRYVRTDRHPSASCVPEATSFDHIYDGADTFDDVYVTIVEALVAAAHTHGHVLYAVPGSPLVLERTTRLLRGDDRITVDVLPALSFLDLAYDRLGIDPIEARIRLIDGHTFATDAAGETGPLLVAHCHANWVLSDIKLAVEHASGDEPVVILQRLGSPDELVTHTTWADLDRTVEADHLTSIYIPRLGAPVGQQLLRFYEIVRQLRAECPWDREQTHQSLTRYALEETYELVEAIGALNQHEDGDGDQNENGDGELIGELGDVLLQVVLHAAIAEEDGRFSLADVAEKVSDKMIRRHPHVFGDVSVETADDVAANWQQIKAAERGDKRRRDTFDSINGALPSLSHAYETHKATAKRGWVWPTIAESLSKVREELDEVAEVLDDPAQLHEEIGDLLMAAVDVCRECSVDPEVALRQATAKYRRRFTALEALAETRGIIVESAPLETLLGLWDDVKAAEHQP